MSYLILGLLESFGKKRLTDSTLGSERECDCSCGLECLLEIIRALGTGSCLSSECKSPISCCQSATVLGCKGRSRRSHVYNISPLDSRCDPKIQRIPGRMFLNGETNLACLFTKQGKKGTNQDAMIVWENFGSRADTVFCGVFDGHGPLGHMAAKRVRDSLPSKLDAHWKLRVSPGDLAGNQTTALTGGSSVDKRQRFKEPFLKAFKAMDRELRNHPSIDCFCSGTTAVALIKQGEDVVIGNVGDSRAVLGTRDKDGRLRALQLTVDLKPNLPGEGERIRRCKGRVFALREEPEVARVWLPDKDSPGLAMARAFGDFCLKDFGLISIPDVSFRRVTDKDEFILLATDGIWDVLSNEEAVEIVGSTGERSVAAEALVERAVRTWRVKHPTSRVDDCAAVCLFLSASPESGRVISATDKAEAEIIQSG